MGSEVLCELLTRKNVNEEHVTSDDLRKYKKILLLTNAHLQGYQAEYIINVGRGNYPRNYGPPFRETQKSEVSNRVYAVHVKNTNMAARALYYKPEISAGFSTLDKRFASLPKKNKIDFRAWLEYQDAYTMHRSARKWFL